MPPGWAAVTKHRG